MTMHELRDAFAAWRKAETGQAVLAYNLIWLLTDPTPVTEAGLRELGADVAEKFAGEWGVYMRLGGIKTLGKLRLLLLGVGE